ncbi:MAG: hypothetical protein V4671_32690 [Armatimonadota bacterium]
MAFRSRLPAGGVDAVEAEVSVRLSLVRFVVVDGEERDFALTVAAVAAREEDEYEVEAEGSQTPHVPPALQWAQYRQLEQTRQSEEPSQPRWSL